MGGLLAGKITNLIGYFKVCGKSGDVNSETVTDYNKARLTEIVSGYEAANVFNCEEIVLFTVYTVKPV